MNDTKDIRKRKEYLANAIAIFVMPWREYNQIDEKLQIPREFSTLVGEEIGK